MNLSLIATLISIAGSAIALLNSLFDKNRKGKIIIAFTAFFIALIAITLGYYQKKCDDKNQEVKSNRQAQFILELKGKLNSTSDSVNLVNSSMRQVKVENDSLKIAFRVMNSFEREIRKENSEHFISTQRSVGDMSERFGYRHLNQVTEKALIAELRPYKGSVFLSLATSTQEAVAFYDQLDRIFTEAGWKIGSFKGTAEFSGFENKDILILFDPKDSVQVQQPLNAFCSIIRILGYKITISNISREGFCRYSGIKYKKDDVFFQIGIYPYTKVEQ